MSKQTFLAGIDAAQIREIPHYDPVTGLFRWRVRRSQRAKIGDIAGSLKKSGYWSISVGNKGYLAHRLAWLYVYGEWPGQYVDHIDGDKANNALVNLRECSHAENHRNIERRGYFEHPRDTPNRFEAFIGIGGRKVRSLGVYPSAEEARAVYLSATREHHGDFSITRREEAQVKRQHSISALLPSDATPSPDQKSQPGIERSQSPVGREPYQSNSESALRERLP